MASSPALDYSTIHTIATTRFEALSREVIITSHQLQQTNLKSVEITARIDTITTRADLLQKALIIIQQLVDRVSATNILRVETLVNSALRAIFFDQELTFKLISEIKRNQNTYRIAFVKNGVEGGIQSIGGGPAAVTSVVLKLLFNRFARCYPLIVLDETLSFLSDRYIQHASKFIHELAAEFGITFILVTHQPLFAAAADMVYEVQAQTPKTSRILIKEHATQLESVEDISE